MSFFYVGAALFIVVFILFVAFPWLSTQTYGAVNTLTNKSLIKQRLNELHTEQQQGLLSDTNRLVAENELKLALLDEIKTNESTATSGAVAILLGALISLFVGIGVFLYIHNF